MYVKLIFRHNFPISNFFYQNIIYLACQRAVLDNFDKISRTTATHHRSQAAPNAPSLKNLSFFETLTGAINVFSQLIYSFEANSLVTIFKRRRRRPHKNAFPKRLCHLHTPENDDRRKKRNLNNTTFCLKTSRLWILAKSRNDSVIRRLRNTIIFVSRSF